MLVKVENCHSSYMFSFSILGHQSHSTIIRFHAFIILDFVTLHMGHNRYIFFIVFSHSSSSGTWISVMLKFWRQWPFLKDKSWTQFD